VTFRNDNSASRSAELNDELGDDLEDQFHPPTMVGADRERMLFTLNPSGFLRRIAE
jgi:hypothetical protein